MKKKVAAIALLLLLLLAALYTIRQRSLAKYVPIKVNSGSERKIVIVGDSWVSGDKLKVDVAGSTITIKGRPGARSREIYELLTPELLADADVLFVVAGVNDTASYIGTDFYVYHISLIAKTCLDNNIKLIVLEVPEYGIEDVSRRMTHGARAFMFRYLFHGGKVDVIEDYRDALRKLNIECVSLEIDDYTRNIGLYKNPSHLNIEGNAILSETIRRAVCNVYN